MADQERTDFSVVFTMGLCTLELTKFAISSHTALKLGKHAIKSYLKITGEYQLCNKEVSAAEGYS